MYPCVPEHQTIVILSYGKTGYLSDWAELQISNGKIELEKLVSFLTRTASGTDTAENQWPNYYGTLSMN